MIDDIKLRPIDMRATKIQSTSRSTITPKELLNELKLREEEFKRLHESDYNLNEQPFRAADQIERCLNEREDARLALEQVLNVNLLTKELTGNLVKESMLLNSWLAKDSQNYVRNVERNYEAEGEFNISKLHTLNNQYASKSVIGKVKSDEELVKESKSLVSNDEQNK